MRSDPAFFSDAPAGFLRRFLNGVIITARRRHRRESCDVQDDLFVNGGRKAGVDEPASSRPFPFLLKRQSPDGDTGGFQEVDRLTQDHGQPGIVALNEAEFCVLGSKGLFSPISRGETWDWLGRAS